MTTLISLCQNAALLGIGVLAYSYARPEIEGWRGLPRTLCSGTLFAVLALLSVVAPLYLAPQFVLDARGTMVALAAVFAGPLAALMAAIPAGIYRFGIGGPFVATALAALAAAIMLGWALRAWAARRAIAITVPHLAVLGLAQSAAVLAIDLALDGPAARLTFLNEILAPLTLASVFGLAGFGLLIVQSDRRRALHALVERRDDSMQRNQEVVFRLLRDELLAGRSLAEQLRAITRISADALGVERVSVFLYDAVQPRATCLARWDGLVGRHVEVPEVWFDQFPDLRPVLAQNLTYRVADARTDPIGKHYRLRYGAGDAPGSVLYCAIRHGDRLVGHVAFATVGRLREWYIEEDTFIHSVANLVGIALLRDELERKEARLRRNQQLIVQILQDELLGSRDLEAQMRAIVRCAADTLGAQRTCVWRYDDDRQVATCLARWNAERSDFDQPPDVDLDAFPEIRRALTTNLSLKAINTHDDPVLGRHAGLVYPERGPMSSLYSAIRHGDRLVGNFGVISFGRQHPWTIEEETFARSLADLAGIALLQHQIERTERQLRRNQQLLVGLVRDQLVGSGRLDDIIRSMTQTVGGALDIEETSVWLRDAATGEMVCADLWDKTESCHRGAGRVSMIPRSPRLLEAFDRDLTVVIEDVARDERLVEEHRERLTALSVKSMLVAAIGGPDAPVGSLTLASRSRIRRWTLEEQSVARSLADLLGLAILRDQLDTRERALRRNQALLTRIVRDVLLQTAPLPTILQSLTEMIGRALGIDRTTLWRFDPSAKVACNVARWDNVAERQDLLPPQPLDLMSPFVVQLRQDTIIDIADCANDPRITPALREMLGAHLPQSGLMALIGAPDQPIGILSFVSVTPRAWALEEQSLVRSLAHLAGFAMVSHSYREAIAALDLVGEGITVQGPGAEVIYANRAARDLGLLGGAATPGGPAEPSEVSEVSWIMPDGTRRELAVGRQRLPDGGVVTTLNDITEQKTRQRRHEQLEEQLRQTTKMEAVGRLAGGIAHDFNNMIGATLGFANFLVEDLPEGSPQRDFARRITQVCERSREVVKQLLAFSRPDDAARRVVDLRNAVIDNGALLKAALPPSTELAMEVGADPLPVLANVGQLYQVLVNLCGNANDALEGKPGSIAVSLARIDRDHPDRQLFEGGGHEPGLAIAIGGRIEPDRAYAAIRVVDSGAGMLQQTIDRIFEPFFSTKDRSHGTGLGLAVVHGIVTAYGGAYVVKSRLGAGSEFAIYLPLVETAPPAVRDHDGPPHGEESVLVLDDEVDLTDMLAIGLGRLGYDVTCCNDPLEALAAFEQDPDAWDIVITDHAMPVMTGTAVVERLKALRPHCPVVLCTGFADGGTEETARAAGADAFLLKPVEPQQLARTVRRLLDQRPAPTVRAASTPAAMA